MRDGAPFFCSALSARDTSEYLQLLPEVIKRLHVDQISGRPSVLSDEDRRFLVGKLGENLGRFTFESRDKFGPHRNDTKVILYLNQIRGKLISKTATPIPPL
jgi:hypothetical protein